MAIARIRIDYDVYPPDHKPGQPMWTTLTFQQAKRLARRLGSGSRVYRNFNQRNKRGEMLGDWWSHKRFWVLRGRVFVRAVDENSVLKTPEDDNGR